MRGYDFRIFPHLSKNAKHEPGQVPCFLLPFFSPPSSLLSLLSRLSPPVLQCFQVVCE